MDKEYWNEYYTEKKAVHFPSPFAEYWAEKGLVKNSVIVDIGCGNGRDSFYFMENCAKHVIGIDQSEVVVNNNNVSAKNLNKKLENSIEFMTSNFVYMELGEGGLNIDFYYSRFTLHAISYEEQREFFLNLNRVMKIGSSCAIEVRTVNDDKFKASAVTGKNTGFTDHSRCFCDPSDILKILLSYDFMVTYFEESTDFAKFHDEAPSVMRILFKKVV